MTAATRGNWNEVWDACDRRKQAKGAVAVNEEMGEGGYVLEGRRGGGVGARAASPGDWQA